MRILFPVWIFLSLVTFGQQINPRNQIQQAGASDGQPLVWLNSIGGYQATGVLNNITSLTVTGLASAGRQCAQISSTGLFSGTGLACGAGGSSAVLPFAVTSTTSTLTITSTGQPFGCNGVSTIVTAGATTAVRLAGSASETLFIGIKCSNGHLILLSPTNTLTCTPVGFAGCDNGSALTYDIVPASVPLASGSGSWTFGSPTDLRAFLQS